MSVLSPPRATLADLYGVEGKAELIDGVVYMASALRYEQHGRPTRLFSAWMAIYELATPGVAVPQVPGAGVLSLG